MNLPRTRRRQRRAKRSVRPCPERPWEVAGRRRQLGGARRHFQSFDAPNRHQVLLRDTALALIAYMEDYWCVPEHAANFERWWGVVSLYARALASDDFTGMGARKRLLKLLDLNQERAWDL